MTLTMNMRTACSWCLIILALGLTFRMIVWPVVSPQKPELISKTELVEAGKVEGGADSYYRFREEAGEWVKIFKEAIPILTVILAFFLKKEKKKT